jgi:hypothetical protein
MRKLLVMVALLGLMVTMGTTSAQQFDPEMFKLMRPAMQIIQRNPASLLTNEGVQKELKIDEDQAKALREKLAARSLGFGFGGKGGGGKGPNAEEAKERMTKFMDKLGQLKDVPEEKLEAKIHEVFKDEIEGPMKDAEQILKPDQIKRLKQISRQQNVLASLTDDDVVKELKIEDEQKTKLKKISHDLQEDLGELQRAAGGGGMGGFRVSPETREKMTALRKEATEKGVNVLTAEQKEKWKGLTGEPFEVKFEFRRPKKDN